MALKFSLRNMLILVAISGVMIAFATGLKNAELRRQKIIADRAKTSCTQYQPYEKEANASYLRRFGAWLAGTGHTKAVKWVHFSPLATVDDVREVAKQFPEIQGVTMQHIFALPDVIEPLERLKFLKKLMIEDGRVSLEAMRAIGRLSSSPNVEFDPVHLDDAFLSDAAASGMPLQFAHSPTSSVSDAGLKFVPRFPRLVGLILIDCDVTDDGLSYLRDHPSLTFAYLDNSQITDVGMEHLLTIPDLRQLSINGCNVTDKGLALISQMPNLWQLRLGKTLVTGQGLIALQQLPMLSDISLNDTEICDDDMDALVGMPNLEKISLANTKMTDVGMKSLATISSRLKKLNVRNTNVTKAGVALFGGKCKVEH